MADDCERLIPIMEERVRRLDAVTADAAKMERFLTETNRFLGDFDSFLKLYPGNQTLELRRNYRSQLETYKKAFEEMLKNMDAFTDKLKAESGSAKLRAERDAERANARAMELAAREQEAAADAQRRNAQALAAYRSAYQSRLLNLHYFYTAVLQSPRSLQEAQLPRLTSVKSTYGFGPYGAAHDVRSSVTVDRRGRAPAGPPLRRYLMHQRLIHDASHRAAVKILHVFSPLLREEELRDAYEEVMPIISEAVSFYDQSLREEKTRLRPMEQVRHRDMGTNESRRPTRRRRTTNEVTHPSRCSHRRRTHLD